MKTGDRVVVATPDRREFRGRLVELRERADGKKLAVIRLDTGWLTTYPLDMVHAEKQR
jgi:hypothetical protein